jgi:hypothetical protein
VERTLPWPLELGQKLGAVAVEERMDGLAVDEGYEAAVEGVELVGDLEAVGEGR